MEKLIGGGRSFIHCSLSRKFRKTVLKREAKNAKQFAIKVDPRKVSKDFLLNF
jgi:hypothetical protein